MIGQEPVNGKCTCSKCGKVMGKVKFFTYKDGSHCELCKECLCLHVDNFDPNTYVWILKKFNVPYIPAEWDKIIDQTYQKKGDNFVFTGTSVVGKYLGKMKLVQWKKYVWDDTQSIMETKYGAKDVEQKEEEIRAAYDKGEITEAEYKTYTTTKTLKEEKEAEELKKIIEAAARGEDLALKGDFQPTKGGKKGTTAPPPKNYYNEDNYVPIEEMPDLAAELTDDDKKYLLLKWGREYTPNEWVQLEKKYSEMMDSFDIQDADSINTLILICKTHLKANQALDSSDYESYTKLTRIYNDLRKTSKFTASQTKDKRTGDFDSIGQLVAWCEKKKGEIPIYKVEAPLDIIDVLLSDMKNYVKELFTQDTSMGNVLDRYLQKKELSMRPDDMIEKSDEDYQEFFKQQSTFAEEDMHIEHKEVAEFD